MPRAGRKRKAGRRQPNGQLARSRPAAREDLLAVVKSQPHRRRYGELAHDHRAECELGRLFMEGLIEQHHYDAGVEYRTIVRDMRIAICAPQGNPTAMDLNRAGGRANDSDADDAKRANKARSAYSDAYRTLGDAGRDALLAVNDVVVWDMNRSVMRGGIDALRSGLKSLAKHFGMLGRYA